VQQVTVDTFECEQKFMIDASVKDTAVNETRRNYLLTCTTDTLFAKSYSKKTNRTDSWVAFNFYQR